MPARRLVLTAAPFAVAVLALTAYVGCGNKPPPDDGPGRVTGGDAVQPIAADAGLQAQIDALAPAEVNGGGATFVEPIMRYWTSEFGKKTGNKVKINYTAKGSGAGVTNMTNKLAVFGCSDAPMNRKQLDEALKTGPVVHVPLVIGAIVPVYNLPGVDAPVKFTGPVLAELFTGKIKKWNDPKLAGLNPGVTLPDLDVQPVYRSDPSGSSFIFTDYLSRVSAEFKKEVGAATVPAWPKGVGSAQPQSPGVAGYVGKTPGALGYIELTFVLDSRDKLKYGSVRNKAGKDVLADLPSITAAAAASLDQKQADEPYSLHELTYNLADAAGDGSYPIAGMSYGIVYQKLSGPVGRATVAFLRWATSAEGQTMAQQRQFAPLPDALREKIAARLAGVTVD